MSSVPIGRYVRTARHLRFVQLSNRIWRQLYRPAIPSGGTPPLRRLVAPLVAGIARAPSVLGATRVRFLNEEGAVDSAQAWNDPARPKLWLYQLHYFDDLCAAEAALRREWHCDLIGRWIRENPPGEGVGWEPYPISLRIVNWIKWHLAGNDLHVGALASLAQQVRYLRRRLEHHLLANHLFENLKALAVAGCFFDGAEADGWRGRALSELERQVREQVLSDGGHFELAPMYHGLVLEGLLDLVNAMKSYGFGAPPWLSDACERMVAWAAAMAHPDGEWAQFSDTSLGFAARPHDLAEYCRRLGLHAVSAQEPFVSLAESGFVRAAYGPLVLFADVGNLGPDYNPAHGHADTFSFELSVRGTRMIVDTGISTYERGPVRQLERSTRAHNTLELDGQDSSEVWAAFRVGRRAKVRSLETRPMDSGVLIAAEHDGYCHLRGRPVHRREWRLIDGELKVTDLVRTAASHEMRARVHLHPRFRARQSSGDFEIFEGELPVAKLFRGSWPIAQLERYEYAAAFGRSEGADVIVLLHPHDPVSVKRFSVRPC